ncbi:hypothetical protein OHB41_49610 [Streptomyces sp. NBC_01571]|uniref:hypothetical protein n=1 Tax=Streptomyces sp. NBC_01571 TaxID=2975883 RepID=UPI00225550BA|nr:hypothetical protein [Streptomyces sp. NBC_01571]MCX4581020.1 hypothetical protein [Streptomyces sp. NBC_01571]
MTILNDTPMAVTRPPLPNRPIPHEKTPDRPTPASPRPHPQNARHDGLDVLIGAAA